MRGTDAVVSELNKKTRIGSVQVPGFMLLVAAVASGTALCLMGYRLSAVLGGWDWMRTMAIAFLSLEVPFAWMYVIVKNSGGSLVFTAIVAPVMFLTGLMVLGYVMTGFNGMAHPDGPASLAQLFIANVSWISWIASVLMSVLFLFRRPD